MSFSINLSRDQQHCAAIRRAGPFLSLYRLSLRLFFREADDCPRLAPRAPFPMASPLWARVKAFFMSGSDRSAVTAFMALGEVCAPDVAICPRSTCVREPSSRRRLVPRASVRILGD